jgi:hypothetical protein
MMLPFMLAVAMTSSLAPVPATQEPLSNIPPRILKLEPDENGKIKLQIVRGGQYAELGTPAPNKRNIKRWIWNIEFVELADVKDLTGYTVGGKSLDRKEILEKLAKGGIVVVCGDGLKVNPDYLKLFRDDVIVLISPEFNFEQTKYVPRGVRLNPGDLEVQPLPAPVPDNVAPLPAPGVNRIQIAPERDR